MTSSTRTADQIIREIADERAELSNSMNDLQRKFSVNAIVNDLNDMVRDQGGDLGRAIGDTVSRNPAAVVLTTVGLAWLFLGQARKANSPHQPQSGNGWYGSGHRSNGNAGQGGNATRPVDASRTSDSGLDKIRDGAAAIGDAASDFTERMSHGLENLSEDAKARVLAARHAAHEARLSSQAAMEKSTRAASGFFNEQPLVVGALAVAAGAAIGGLFPHTKFEDDAMGDTSDQLFAQAQAIYREERDKAVAAAKVAASDVKQEIKDIGADLEGMLPEGKNVGEVIADRTSDAAKRVTGHATHDADASTKNHSQT